MAVKTSARLIIKLRLYFKKFSLASLK